jgi:hypothetical protein
MTSSTDTSPSSAPSSSNKAYPVLLAISLCLSAVLCWLYVTKPVIVTASSDESAKEQKNEPADHQKGKGGASSSGVSSSKKGKSQLIPSDGALPGVKPASGASSLAKSSHRQPAAPIDPLMLSGSENGTGWETTNARVQHILRADAGNGERSNIVLNVPVLYQTRTMRWTPGDVEKAREILTRLMVYESNLSKLKLEGQALLGDWNALLEKTVPSSALRADSPSLPYNRGVGRDGLELPESGNTIKVE